LYSNRSQNLGQAFWQDTAAIIAIIIVAISIYFIFKFAPRLMKYTGQAGLTSLSKVMGFIVIGIGVQMIISSINSIVKNIVLELNNIP
jgi:multiple antibiotic resistance protein